jgi:rhodanese-related sulfurtransferase
MPEEQPMTESAAETPRPMTAAQLVAEAAALIDHVSPQQAAAERTGDAVVLLDVREPAEWERHIEGAVRIPRGLLEFHADPTSPRHDPALDPGRRVIVYCQSGIRSVLATATLRRLGFTDVVNMTGGFTAWQDAGLPTVGLSPGT